MQSTFHLVFFSFKITHTPYPNLRSSRNPSSPDVTLLRRRVFTVLFVDVVRNRPVALSCRPPCLPLSRPDTPPPPPPLPPPPSLP